MALLSVVQASQGAVSAASDLNAANLDMFLFSNTMCYSAEAFASYLFNQLRNTRSTISNGFPESFFFAIKTSIYLRRVESHAYAYGYSL